MLVQPPHPRSHVADPISTLADSMAACRCFRELDDVLLTPRLALIALPGPVIEDVIRSGRQAFREHVGVDYPPEWPTESRHVLGSAGIRSARAPTTDGWSGPRSHAANR